ncbi:NfeD family protein [Holosporaceae bacterium 'Namur']|nr:NfeD family protein [Holosporaceae bacterium 'Namur']
MEYFTKEFWFLLTGIFVVLEVVLGFTIVCLFAALSCFTVGIMVTFSLAPNTIQQLAYFFGFTFLWTILAYKPLVNLVKKAPKDSYNNIIGGIAEVTEKNLIAGKIGAVKWSGTIFKAMLAIDAEEKEISVGKNVTIVAVKENIFIVK